MSLAKAGAADLGSAGFGEVVREVFVGSHRERIVRLHTGQELTVWSHERGTDEPRRGDAVEIRVAPSSVRVVRDPDASQEPAA
nr:TOBE domain-containing protein [Amycolatopsis sp. FDAARGOS 1241]